jgi:hypothetical protein
MDVIDYGIKNITILGKKPEKNKLEEEKILQLESKTKSSITKMESILNTKIILLCKIINKN